MPPEEESPLFRPPSGTTATVWENAGLPEQRANTQFLLLGASEAAPELLSESQRALGFSPHVTAHAPFPRSAAELEAFVAHHTSQAAEEIFLIPAIPEFGLREREIVAELAARLRRTPSAPAVHYDQPRLDHPLHVQALADAALAALCDADGRPQFPADRAGLLVVARGDSDSAARAGTYALMRLLWEHIGAADARVAFLRHDKPFVTHVLADLAATGRAWLVVPANPTPGESYEHLAQIVRDHIAAHPAAQELLRLVSPPAGHPALRALVVLRMVALFRQKRQQASAKAPAPRRAETPQLRVVGSAHTGLAAETHSAEHLRQILPVAVVEAPRVFVKVTWHGYAPGTYTDPASLDLLLTALDGQAVVLEGHTSSRNLGGAEFDWEIEAEPNRAWIRAQEQEYLRRTGIAEVLRRHGAQYLNITEAFWDGRCMPAADVRKATGLHLAHEELFGYIPDVMWRHRGAPFVSFARFKGPTRLGVSNLFGLIPDALRARWHGPNITYFAEVCCEIARLYGALFDTHGLVEAWNVAVKWDKKGLYRSRWGNYDLIEAPKLVTHGPGFAAADVLAARLQGQNVAQSAFYDVVRERLDWATEAETLELPDEWLRRLR